MANQEHLDILAKGVAAWNAWRMRNPDTMPDLSFANVEKSDLRGVDLHDANLENLLVDQSDLRGSLLWRSSLTGANLEDADVRGIDFSSASLFGANLRNAKLCGARLVDLVLCAADMRNADLSSTDIGDSYFVQCKLNGTDFSGASIMGVTFGDVDLSETVGLTSVVHGGPSTIGVDTIYKSKGKIPASFLRGAGVPESFITYMKSLTGAAFEFYSCFISYSTKDQEFADRLYADLQSKGVRCWFAPRDAQRGRKLHEQIDEAIRLHEKLLLILSSHSMSSNWVKTEIANARAREKREGMQMLFPVSIVPYSSIQDWKCFDADTGIDSAKEIREYLIADFSNWRDHDSYQKEFAALLRDLQSKRTTMADTTTATAELEQL